MCWQRRGLRSEFYGESVFLATLFILIIFQYFATYGWVHCGYFISSVSNAKSWLQVCIIAIIEIENRKIRFCQHINCMAEIDINVAGRHRKGQTYLAGCQLRSRRQRRWDEADHCTLVGWLPALPQTGVTAQHYFCVWGCVRATPLLL